MTSYKKLRTVHFAFSGGAPITIYASDAVLRAMDNVMAAARERMASPELCSSEIVMGECVESFVPSGNAPIKACGELHLSCILFDCFPVRFRFVENEIWADNDRLLTALEADEKFAWSERGRLYIDAPCQDLFSQEAIR